MTVYALKHPDGRWLYHLPVPDAFRAAAGFGHTMTGVFADGQPMEKLTGDWWATPSEARRLTVTVQPGSKTVGYQLTDPAVESVRYPATLSVETWDERNDREGDTLWELYDRVQEPQEPIEHVYDGPIMALEGREPPGPDEPQWVAQLPHALTNHPEYLHLFPGHIPGSLVDHLMGVFKAMPRVEYVLLNFQNKPGVYVSLRVPYDEPRTEFRADTGRNGQKLKRGRTVQVLVSRSLTLPIPSRVTADTYEQALDLWEQRVAYWTGVVAEASVAACSHCDGKGYVPTGAEKYPTPR